MKRKVAAFISLIFHPTILALATPFLIIYRQFGNMFYAFKWASFSGLFLILVILVLFLLWRREVFRDFDITRRRKRVVFYGVVCLAAILYFAIAVSFKGVFFSLSIVAIGVVIGAILLEVVNLFLKVSMHTAVSSAFVLTAFVLFGIAGFLFSF